ncbi:sex hormone-binding globulin [Leucoraja erinacea]|uniref:sex hormone-binding globulin n=1 Tax=Leucoraja erinaceus TaxID=7782 RepID=UPI0024541F93|nr:sex hormone-binding globulin [Leucoraja erinacea]
MGPVWQLSALGLLAAFVSADLSLFQQRAFVMPERIYSHCFHWGTNKSPKLHSLSAGSTSVGPSHTLEALIEGADSFKSEFDLRTLDPEGVLFSGDTDEGDNWFVLALRGGHPEIQISNKYCNITVQSGDQLSDGHWRRIKVTSTKNSIQLLVNQQPSLSITILPSVGLEGSMVKIRIAVGNLLFNESKLLMPVKQRLDACISNWDWLQQNTSWLDKKVSSNPNIQCPTSIMSGTFFQGLGMAVFKTSGFWNVSESLEEWVLRFEGVIRPTKHSGMVLAVLSESYSRLLQLDFVRKDMTEVFRLSLGGTELVEFPGPSQLCQGQPLSLTVSGEEATLAIGDQLQSQPLGPGLFASLHNAWFHTDALIFFGGLPALESMGYNWSYYQGCMQGLKLQEQPVDFNRAYFADESISTHSCPSPVA